MLRRLFLGVPLLSFWLAGLLALGTLVASRVEGAAFVPASWAALALQVTGLTQLTGAGSATDDDFVVYDTSATAIKRIARSELALALGVGAAGLYASKTSDQAITNGVAAKVTFDTEVFDTDGAFATSTYTAPRTAKYAICPTITYNGGGNGQTVNIELRVNGSALANTCVQHASNDLQYITLAPVWYVSATATNTYEVWIVEASAGSGGTVEGTTATGVAGCYLAITELH